VEKIGAGDEIRTHDFNLGKLGLIRANELIFIGVLTCYAQGENHGIDNETTVWKTLLSDTIEGQKTSV
jgi:hypothetical protein